MLRPVPYAVKEILPRPAESSFPLFPRRQWHMLPCSVARRTRAAARLDRDHLLERVGGGTV